MEFKFSCPHCGRHISATTEYVGVRTTCPTCSSPFDVPAPITTPVDGKQSNVESKAPNNSSNASSETARGEVASSPLAPMKAIKLTVAALFVGSLAAWGLYEYRARVAVQEQIRLAVDARRHEQEAVRRREQAEHNFDLSEAYKQPPASYVESPDQRLLGRISPTSGGDSTWGAVTAQDFDTTLLADEIFSGRCAQAQAAKASAVASFAQGMWLVRSEVPNLDIADQYDQDNKVRDLIRDQTATRYEPQRKADVKAAFDEREARIFALAKEHRLMPLSRDVRVRVLDISGHYAKLTVIDGDYVGQTVFISPSELLIK